VEDLAIESFFPADAATGEYLRGLDEDRLRSLSDRNPQLLQYIGPPSA
jgi:hypothetical protein